MTSTYISYGNTQEEEFREKLYNLIDKYNEYDSIKVFMNVSEFQELCKELHLNFDLSAYKANKEVKIGYYLTGWANNLNAERSDAVVASIPEHNNYGYAGENNTIVNKIPAKVLYEYITNNYTYIGGMLRRKICEKKIKQENI